jgi:hypothetical protein
MWKTGHLEDLGVDGKINWTLKQWKGDLDWIFMAYNRDTWRALVNTVMILCFLQNAGNFRLRTR